MEVKENIFMEVKENIWSTEIGRNSLEVEGTKTGVL